MAGFGGMETRKRPTVERLRNEIDHGAAHDKIAFPDPAIAPLGADAEAGGTPATAETLSEAMGEGALRAERGVSRDWRHQDLANGGVVISWGLLVSGALAFGLAGGFLVTLRFG